MDQQNQSYKQPKPRESDLEWVDKIKWIALENVENALSNQGNLLEYLKRWWCWHYNRPYLDPLLSSYTLEELLLEYYEIIFLKDDKVRQEAISSKLSIENDDESILKKLMGDAYQTKEEMIKTLENIGGSNG